MELDTLADDGRFSKGNMEVRLYARENSSREKPSGSVDADGDTRLLVGRKDAAQMLSISERALDYLIANGELTARHIGARVLIPITDLRRYALTDHPAPLATLSRTA